MRRKKSLGQHFLHDPGVLGAIVRGLEWREGELVCEIGPGTGRLTARLRETVGVERLVCVERDRDMIAHLSAKLPDVQVLSGDATRFPWETLVPDGAQPGLVCGNLPYNVSAPIYFHLLLAHRRRFRTLVLMFQREVAERIVAGPGSKKYGPPSVLTHILADASRLMVVKPRSFRPPPRVDSAVIRVWPLRAPRYDIGEEEVAAFGDFVHAAFRQRRKTIFNNLRELLDKERAGEALASAELDPRARAEALAPQSLVRLWRCVLRSPR